MSGIKKALIGLILFGNLIVSGAPEVWAAQLYIPATKAEAGGSVAVPIMIDRVENLAGMQLMIRYDPSILKYNRAQKTTVTSSWMHAVNHEKSGVLNIVMVGTKGAKGENISLLAVTFDLIPTLKRKRTARIVPDDVQLINDQGKKIQCRYRASYLTILPRQISHAR